MTDIVIRCRGMHGGEPDLNVCNKRMQCQRYLLHLDDIDHGRTHMPHINHEIDLGYGKTFSADISNGCCEYEPTNDNQQTNNYDVK